MKPTPVSAALLLVAWCAIAAADDEEPTDPAEEVEAASVTIFETGRLNLSVDLACSDPEDPRAGYQVFLILKYMF